VPEWSDILKILGGFLAGLGAGFSLKVVLVRRGNQVTAVQKGNVVGGNQAGRDVNIGGDRQK
jgi:hypothetical protein